MSNTLKIAVLTIICRKRFEKKVVKHENITAVLISDVIFNSFVGALIQPLEW